MNAVKRPGPPAEGVSDQIAQDDENRTQAERLKRRLPKDVRDKTKRLFKLLSLKQKAFCKTYVVPASALSSALTGDRSISEPLWLRVVDGLEAELTKFKKHSGANWDAAMAQALLDDLFASAGRHPMITASLPGETLPLGSSIYLQRECDSKLRNALAGGARLMVITGAPQSGRSSLLLRAADWGKQLGFSVITLNFANYEPNLRNMGGEDLVGEIASALGFRLAREPYGSRTVAAFANHIFAQDSRTLFLLDGIDGIAVQDPTKVWPSLLLLLDLETHFAGRAPRKFAAMTVFGGEAWSAYAGSAYEGHFTQETRHFVEQEIAIIGKSVTDETPAQKTINSVYSLFGGHPYLTHLFFDYIRQGIKPDQIAEEARQLNGPFRAHADRMVRKLRHIAANPQLARVTNLDFSRLCEEISGRSKDIVLIPRIHRSLLQLGVIDRTGKVFHIYRSIFDREL